MLARRLTQRGVALSGGALATVLVDRAASAGVPTSVVSSTIKAVTLVAAGQGAAAGVISAKVAALAKGVLQAMLLSKLKNAIAVLALGLLATGTVALTCRVAAAQSGRPPAASDRPAARRGSDPARSEMRSGYLELENVDPIKGIIKGAAISTDEERTIYTYRQESWVLKVGSATKIVIEGMQAKLADLLAIKPEPGSSDGRMKLVFAEWEHGITADRKARFKEGTAIRLEGKGAKVRGIVQAKNPGKHTLTIKRIDHGFGGDLVSESASAVPVAKEVRVTIDHKAATFDDLKPGMTVALQLSAVKELVLVVQAYGARVDGVLKVVDAGKHTVSVNILSAQMTAEGVPVARDAKVMIDGKEGRLSDLRAGMRVTLQMAAEPEASLIVGVTKGKTAAGE
jgi:hypothetical protein